MDGDDQKEQSAMTEDLDLTLDHAGITDDLAARRYFAKFERITSHLSRVAGEMQ